MPFRRGLLRSSRFSSFHHCSLISFLSSMVTIPPQPYKIAAEQSGSHGHYWNQKDWNSRMKAFAREGRHGEALRMFGRMKRSGVVPNVLCCNTVIDALVTMGRPREALAIFGSMITSGVEPSVSSYNILIKLYSFCPEEFYLVTEVIIMMKKLGFRPDSITFSTIIAGLCRFGRIDEALIVLDWMVKEKCLPTVYTYTPIVQGYCLRGSTEKAQLFMSFMENIGFPPNVVTYNILIFELCRRGEFDEVKKILKDSILKGWKPNEVTCNTYMAALLKWDKTKEAIQVLEIMTHLGQHPSIATVNIIIDCLCRDSKFSEAISLLKRSIESQWSVSIVGYNTMMSRLCNVGRWFSVLTLLADLLKKGIPRNTTTFNILLNGLCKSGRLLDVRCVLHDEAFDANVVSYNTLIYWSLHKGMIEEVQVLLCNMSVKEIALDIITYEILIDGFCKLRNFSKAVDFYLASIETHGHTDLIASVIYWLLRSKKLKLLLKMFEVITRQSSPPFVQIHVLLIEVFCNQGFCRSIEMLKILDFLLDQMLQTM